MRDELIEQLRLLRPTAKFEYAKDQFLMIGMVMREAANEIERLRRGEFICRSCCLRKDAESQVISSGGRVNHEF